MNPELQINLLTAIKDHFPLATDGDGEIIWEAVQGLAWEDAYFALKEHRRECGKDARRPDPERVKSIAHSRFRARQPATRAKRIADELIDRDPELKGMDPVSATVEHYTQSWAGVKDHQGLGQRGARSCILAGCRTALEQQGLEPAKADELARSVVGLKPGERIERVIRGEVMDQPAACAAGPLSSPVSVA